MLINIKEMVKLWDRNQSSARLYVEKGLITKPTREKIDCGHKAQFWNEGAILLCLPNIKEFQSKYKGGKKRGKKRKNALCTSYRPPLTPAQQAANNAFNLCVN